MKRADLIIAAPHIYTMEGSGVGYIQDGALACISGKIAAVGKREDIFAEYSSGQVIDRKNTAIFPGFIDAHMHISECMLRGLAQDTSQWMMYGFGPFEKALTQEVREAGIKLALIEGIKAGTTTFGESGLYTDSACTLIEQAGARGNITVKIREAIERIYEPGELYEFSEEYGKKTFDDAIKAFEKWNGKDSGRITINFGPQGADFVSRDLLLKIKEEAEKRGARIQMHTQQGSRETYQIVKRYGIRPVEYLNSIGFLDKNLVAVHLTDADDDEARIVAESGAGMILCSGSIGIIDGMAPPAKVFQDAGGKVALGSDQAPGNNSHNIINEMKLTSLFNKMKYEDPEVMPAWKALRMATIEGAEAIGMDKEIGSLKEGKRADMIVVDLTAPSMLPVITEPMRNIVPNLVYSARGNEVCISIVDGRVIYKDGVVFGLDEQKTVEECIRFAPQIGKAGSEDFWRVNGTNAVFMRENKL